MRRTLLLAWYAASVGLGLAVIGLAALAQQRRTDAAGAPARHAPAHGVPARNAPARPSHTTPTPA